MIVLRNYGEAYLDPALWTHLQFRVQNPMPSSAGATPEVAAFQQCSTEMQVSKKPWETPGVKMEPCRGTDEVVKRTLKSCEESQPQQVHLWQHGLVGWP